MEIILLPKCCLCLFILVSEVAFEAWAEINVPAPETAQGRFGVLVVVCAELAVLAGVFLFCHVIIVFVVLLPPGRRSAAAPG